MADENHDGIISKELYQKIQQPVEIKAQDYGIVEINKTTATIQFINEVSNWTSNPNDFFSIDHYEKNSYIFGVDNDSLILGNKIVNPPSNQQTVLPYRSGSSISDSAVVITPAGNVEAVEPTEASLSYPTPALVFTYNGTKMMLNCYAENSSIDEQKLGNSSITKYSYSTIKMGGSRYLYSESQITIPAGTIVSATIESKKKNAAFGSSITIKLPEISSEFS